MAQIFNFPTDKEVKLAGEDFSFMDEKVELVMKSYGQLVTNGQVGVFKLSGVDSIVSGNSYTITSGYVFYDNEVFAVEGFTGTSNISNQVPVLDILEESGHGFEPHTIFEGIQQVGSIQLTTLRKITISIKQRGTGLVDYDLVKDNEVKKNSRKASVLPFMSIDYDGPLTNFNLTTGLGIGDYEGWAICDGRNGTPDRRGTFTVYRTDSNPANGNTFANDPDFFNMGTYAGEKEVSLTASQHAPHGHTYKDSYYAESSGGGNVLPSVGFVEQVSQNVTGSGDSDNDNSYLYGLNRDTEAQGLGEGHNNIPPAFVSLKIMYIG